jgi:CRISPR system Cascade subunit CasD
MSNKFLLLWFEAPLQSWGADSKFGRRDTLPFPTKSGVAGLLLCAMGASGPQNDLLAKIAPLRQTVVSFVRTKRIDHEEPEKVDREPLLRDFHMVGSGYDEKDLWQTLLIPKKMDGGAAVGGGTKMTYRYYLQDAKFAIVVEVPASDADEFAQKLQNPVYDLYLGRKNCVPTDFIFRGVFETEDGALQAAAKIANGKEVIEDFRVMDGEHEGDILALNDVPVQFGETKKYRDRRVTVVPA